MACQAGTHRGEARRQGARRVRILDSPMCNRDHLHANCFPIWARLHQYPTPRRLVGGSVAGGRVGGGGGGAGGRHHTHPIARCERRVTALFTMLNCTSVDHPRYPYHPNCNESSRRLVEACRRAGGDVAPGAARPRGSPGNMSNSSPAHRQGVVKGFGRGLTIAKFRRTSRNAPAARIDDGLPRRSPLCAARDRRSAPDCHLALHRVRACISNRTGRGPAPCCSPAGRRAEPRALNCAISSALKAWPLTE